MVFDYWNDCWILYVYIYCCLFLNIWVVKFINIKNKRIEEREFIVDGWIILYLYLILKNF